MADERLIEDYRKLIQVTKAMSSTLDVDAQLPGIMDAAISLTHADSCLLVLFDKNNALEVRAERHADASKVAGKDPGKHGKYSRSVIQDVVDTGQPIFVLDTDLNNTMKDRASIQSLQLRTVMCTPLHSRTGLMGALYVHSTTPTRAFNEQKKEIFMALSDHAAIALDNAQLYAASIADPLTGLYNHSYCLRRLDEEIQRANRYGRYLSFLLIDLDKFKVVNDTLGHRAGDRLLGKVADVIRAAVRRVDIPVRYGGDEFAVILPDTGGPVETHGGQSGAEILGERMRVAIAAIETGGAKVSASIGIATHPSDGAKEGQASDLIERADAALYGVKRKGGDGISRHAPASFVG
ncbi:MAG: sensor domain-containing diguanylate cyclase [Deltaproteobacteria bacterium]|nr:sensor domain-containing diguanylate cyclase [Deltaproteobacteria bacterium]